MEELTAGDSSDDESAETVSLHAETPSALPERIDRYRVESVLGKGGFGIVYLAHDKQLDRLVALKVPHADLISRPEDAEAYLAEARIVASLDHPNIVPVHDVGSTDGFPCYVVSKYIKGKSLSARIKLNPLEYLEAAELIATVAEALGYAHKQGLVHRDVKPGNILIDDHNKPFVVDFGLALREEDLGKGPRFAGTPAYMSPEQASGEGHRVDGRSDIFSLGVVFYELLTGRRPFRGESKTELFEQITNYEPRPIRQYDEKLPREIERICYKAISKRARERYSTAHDLAEDLRSFVAAEKLIGSIGTPGGMTPSAFNTGPPTPTPATAESIEGQTASTGSGPTPVSPVIKIVPKGLRSFDANDADFFLDLLPGPRDREGLPESLRFWKTRIEETDPENTFSVGLIYGPSGCGKSSLVKAGLLPRLSKDVISVYVEASSDQTESRLLRGLRKRCPTLDGSLSLKDTLAAMRRGHGVTVGKKVLIILDQFEQWLHAKNEELNTDLVQALRQCDGGRVQCIVMVRDDFWMAVTRFMRQLEAKLIEDHNISAVDLFPERHAQKVLAAFGRAFGALPSDIEETSADQKQFLKQSVAGLAEEGKVICVRLSLFAEMMKGKTWVPEVLKEVGGPDGVGAAFLEETFCSSTASPEHRYHQNAARGVLKALLPNPGTDIKGQMKPHGELLKLCGYKTRPQDFETLIRILDRELRLISPTYPDLNKGDEATPTSSDLAKYYQLTHDFLVQSVSDWVTSKERETRRGRARLRMAEQAAVWGARRINSRLPSWLEWMSYRYHVSKKDWTSTEKAMMRAVLGPSHVFSTISRLATVLMFILLFTIIPILLRTPKRLSEVGSELNKKLQVASDAQVPAVLKEIEAHLSNDIPSRNLIMIKQMLLKPNGNWIWEEEKERSLIPVHGKETQLCFTLLPKYAGEEFSDLSKFVVEQILRSRTPSELSEFRAAALDKKAPLIPELWRVVHREGASEEKLKAVIVLSWLQGFSSDWAIHTDMITAVLSDPEVEILEVDKWFAIMNDDVKRQMRNPMKETAADSSFDKNRRQRAISVLNSWQLEGDSQ